MKPRAADIQHRLRALSPLQRALLAHRLNAEAATPDAPGAAQLVAYVVPSSENTPSAANVRDFLKSRVPEFMVPSTVVVLDDLPRTPNGKVDRNALPEPRSGSTSDESMPPRNDAEEQLAAVWSDVLGVERIGIHDNFFEIGGDSISSIQIISRANQLGLKLKPRQFFEYPTIAELAHRASAAETTPPLEPAAAGPVALTPIQQWFFERSLPDPSHWNQVVSLDLAADVAVERLEDALRSVAQSHDAFRLRFVKEEAGWSQHLVGPETNVISVAHHDLSATPEEARAQALDQIWMKSQTTFDLAEGPLLHAAFVDRGSDAPFRLILSAHHLVVDAVSWQTLLDEIERVYAQLQSGEQPQPTPPGCPFSRWADALAEYVETPALQAERAFWFEQANPNLPNLPTDGSGPNMEAGSESYTLRLDHAETTALSEATVAYGMRLHEIVLTALAGALARWTGAPQIRIDLEGHGRVEINEALDLARTVGWFTALYPVLLEAGPPGDPRRALTSVKEQLRAVPNQGIGYGVLRYLGDHADRQRLEATSTDVLFNYLGQSNPGFADGSPFRRFVELWGSHGPEGERAHQIEINAHLDAGALTIRWTYHPAVHTSATVERLAAKTHAALQALVVHCLDPDAGAYTPSDFPDIDLDQDALDALLGDFD